MDAFRLLGLRKKDADERAVKRAYAQRLKQVRPDEDPEGFQRLHEAYRSALAQVRCRDDGMAATDEDPQGTVDDENGDAEAAYSITLREDDLQSMLGTDSFSPPVEAIGQPDPHSLAREILELAERESPERLRAWLSSHDDLYSLALKRHAGEHLFHLIAWEPHSVSAANLKALSGFFDRTLPEWVEQRVRVREAVEGDRADLYGESTPFALRQLKRPFRWPRALLVATIPPLAQRIARLSHRLQQDYGGDEVPGLDPAQARFFGQLASPTYFGRWRWAAIGLAAAITALALSALVVIGGKPAQAWPVAWTSFTGVVAILGVWQGVRLVWRSNDTPFARLRWPVALLPLWLALGGMAMAMLLPDAQAASLLLLAPAALAYPRQCFDALRFGLAAGWSSSLLADAIPLPSPWITGLAGAAAGVAICNAVFAYRHHLPLSATVGNRFTMMASYLLFAISIAFRFTGA